MEQLATEQVGSSPELEMTIETFGRWALNLVGNQNIIDHEQERWISSLLMGIDVSTSDREYFVDEVNYVLGRFLPGQRARYLEVPRSGRGRAPAIPRGLRRQLLTDVIAPYEERKSQDGKVDWHDVALEVAEAPSQRYDVVVVDESQDLSANQVRAVLSHLSEDHVTTFIIDAVQRIYPQGFQWTELGINMRPEMVFTMTRNHRNTAEVVRLASSLVRDLPREEDGVLPDHATCQESGVRPKVVVGKYSAQISYMLDQAQPHIANDETIAILHPRGGGWFDFTRKELRRRSIDYCELTRTREWPTGPELLALSTIHSAKGLEFNHVLMPGLSDEVTPHGDGDGDGTLDSLRRLVAMGVGRAKGTVMLGYKPGERSSVFDLIDPATYDLVEV